MVFRNTVSIAITATVGVVAGSTGVLHATDPSNPNECTQTPMSCWDEVFCANVFSCLDSSPNEKAFYDCLLLGVVAYERCSNKICHDTWTQTQVLPTNQQCLDQYENRRDNYCEFQIPSTLGQVCGKRDHHFGPSGNWADSLTTACKQAAHKEYLACLDAATPNISPSTFSDNTLLDGSLKAGEWSPSEGIWSGTLLLVPIDEVTARVDRAVVSSAVWSGNQWQRVVIGEYFRGADMFTEVSVDLRSISQANYGSDLDLLVEWRDGEELVMALDHFLPIAESGIPGDFDRDGERTAHDLTAFLDAYENSAPRADRNGDRVVNAEDLALFLAEYDTE